MIVFVFLSNRYKDFYVDTMVKIRSFPSGFSHEIFFLRFLCKRAGRPEYQSCVRMEKEKYRSKY